MQLQARLNDLMSIYRLPAHHALIHNSPYQYHVSTTPFQTLPLNFNIYLEAQTTPPPILSFLFLNSLLILAALFSLRYTNP